MRALPAPARAGLLLVVVLLGAAHCSSPSADELSTCSHVECTAGRCHLENGEPQCVCGAEEIAQHLTCEVKVIYVVDGNDTRSTATPLGVPTASTPASIDPSHSPDGDLDFYAFRAVPQHVYRFTCASGSLSACSVRLLDPTGATVDSEASPPGGSVSVNVKANLDATYYVLVSASLGGTGTYTYRLEDIGLDDYGDTPAAATALTPNGPAGSGVVDAQGDVDVFSLPVVVGHSYYFGCALLPGCHLDLRNADGLQVGVGAAGFGGGVELRFRATASQTLYVLLSGFPGPYRYVLADYGLDDYGDTPAAATPVVLPAALAGRLDLPTDLDVVTFAGTAGHRYQAQCEDSSASGCTVTVRSSSGVTLAGPSPGPTAAAPADGPLYVEVSATFPGTYTLHIDDLGP